MPELPEVETVRRGLERFAVGRRSTHVEVGRSEPFAAPRVTAVIDGLTDTTIRRRTSARQVPAAAARQRRRGDDPPPHERPGADRAGRHTAPAPHPRRAAPRDDGTRPAQELWFVDPRTFGEVVVFDPTNVAVEMPDVANLGLDPIADDHAAPVPAAASARGTTAEAAAARPARHRRHRQHLRRRDPARRSAPS